MKKKSQLSKPARLGGPAAKIFTQEEKEKGKAT